MLGQVLLIVTSFFIFFSVPVVFAQTPTLPKAPYVSSYEVRQWIKQEKKVTFLDVREPSEYEAGHIETAINIPYVQVENRLDEIPKGHSVVVYCIYSSWRAPYVANLLADYGFNNVYTLEGGASGWHAGGQVIYATQATQTPEVLKKYPDDMAIELKHPPSPEYKEKIRLTKKELQLYDGQNGRSAYVAIDGVIYDVTQSRLWRGGAHDPSHGKASAGRDLSEILKDSPHGKMPLKGFPVVGYLVEAQ